jgi:xylan 1,4-beta-xylosidase
MLKNILDLAAREHANIEGMLTWAFEFEGQPYFDGFRTLATNGIDKPVLNLFRMAGQMQGNRVKVESSAAVPMDAILAGGVRGADDVDALAVHSNRSVSVLAWNYHDDDVAAPDAAVRLSVAGLPDAARRVRLQHYRIDRQHSNAYERWKQMGSPQSPSTEQYAALETAGQLELLESPRWIDVRGGKAEVRFALPRQGVSLLELSW